VALMRIPFDSLVLRAVACELRATVVSGVVQRVVQPSAQDLVLDIRGRGETHRLLLSCDAVRARVHLTEARHPAPAVPPAFCMLCRKYIEGATIVSVDQRGFDRILDLRLRNSSGDVYTLVAEIMGKHSNVILNGPDGSVLDAAKRITHRQSRFREVLPGVPYIAPPPQADRIDPFTASDADITTCASEGALAERILARYAGMSPFLAQEIAARAAASSPAEAWHSVFGSAAADRWSPVIVRSPNGAPTGAYALPLAQVISADQVACASISRALDKATSAEAARASLDGARSTLEGEIRRALRSLETHRDAMRRSVEESARAETYRETGDLLLSQLHAVPEGADSVELTDYYAQDAPPRVVALDPRKTPRENAETWFRRYRKARDGAEAVGARLEQVERDVAALRAGAEDCATATDTTALEALRERLRAAGALRAENETVSPESPARTPDFDGRKIRTVHTAEGWLVLFGENAEANDYLTRRIAASNDLWLHVRSNTSAHVVIRTGNRPDSVPQSVVERAASIAARHSAAKHSSLVPVDCTLAKHVRRPKGAAPGTVTYRNERTLYVTPAEA
jgi:predicted ribosome quality control (RQC) complex YloA/Tae2 family protein